MQKVSNKALAEATTLGKQLISATSAIQARQNLGLAAVASSGAYSDLTGIPSLSTVATSGSYNDLTDKPSGGGGTSFGAVYEFFEHFISSSSLAGNMTAATSGGQFTSVTVTGNQFGILQLRTLAVAAVNQSARVASTGSQITFGAGELFFSIRFAQASPQWFDATTLLGAFRAGILGSISADSNGCYFRAKTNTLEFVHRTGGSESTVNIGTLVQNNFVTASFKVNAAGTSVQVYLDGVLITTVAVNLAGIKAFQTAFILREAAIATDVQVNLDFMAMRYTPTSPFFVVP
jgi:hypothetical protein